MSNRKFSKNLVDGPHQAASRSMLRGVGFETADFSKPLVGIASTWSKVTPCNMHINELAELVETSSMLRDVRAFFLIQLQYQMVFLWGLRE